MKLENIPNSVNFCTKCVKYSLEENRKKLTHLTCSSTVGRVTTPCRLMTNTRRPINNYTNP